MAPFSSAVAGLLACLATAAADRASGPADAAATNAAAADTDNGLVTIPLYSLLPERGTREMSKFVHALRRSQEAPPPLSGKSRDPLDISALEIGTTATKVWNGAEVPLVEEMYVPPVGRLDCSHALSCGAALRGTGQPSR